MSRGSRNPLPLQTKISNHPVDVLYEDDYYIVFDKPAGLLVIPSPRKEQRTLVDLVNRQYAAWASSWKLHPCHRIDRDTSGAIIFAKGKRSQKAMMALFKRRAVTKKYIALVHGKMPVMRGEFRRPVNRDFLAKAGRKQSGERAVTRYRVVGIKKRYSIVEVQPVTGRTNQIRIHFSQAGHPLVGERKFAFARDYALKFRRTALHAAYLEWRHPFDSKTVRIQSRLPKDMHEFLNRN